MPKLDIPKIKPINVKQYEFKQSQYPQADKLPFRSIIVSASQGGKGILIQNLILKIYRGCFERIYIVSPTAHIDEKNDKQHIQWTDYILGIMLTYNDKMGHSATGMTPKKARNKENELKARINVAMKASKDKIYPELKVGDKVKIVRKKAITEKDRTSNFLQGDYTVEEINRLQNH